MRENGFFPTGNVKIFPNLVKNLPAKILDTLSDLGYLYRFNRPKVAGKLNFTSLFGGFLWLKSLLVN